jgi:hypothetical protein
MTGAAAAIENPGHRSEERPSEQQSVAPLHDQGLAVSQNKKVPGRK